MATNVNTFWNFVNYVSNKVQVGSTLSPSQFNLVANRAQMVLFEKDYETLLATEEISEYLRTFLVSNPYMVPANGELAYPSDYQHLASMGNYYNGTFIQCSEIKNTAWGLEQVSQLRQATKRFSKFTKGGTYIEFLPKNIGIIQMDYFRTPVAPVWGYTVVSSRPVYDASTSTNFEWNETFLNAVAAIFLQLIGINLREGDLLQFANQFTAETNSKL